MTEILGTITENSFLFLFSGWSSQKSSDGKNGDERIRSFGWMKTIYIRVCRNIEEEKIKYKMSFLNTPTLAYILERKNVPGKWLY